MSITQQCRALVRRVARDAAMAAPAQSESATFNYRWEHVQGVTTTALRLAELVGADRDVVEATE